MGKTIIGGTAQKTRATAGLGQKYVGYKPGSIQRGGGSKGLIPVASASQAFKVPAKRQAKPIARSMGKSLPSNLTAAQAKTAAKYLGKSAYCVATGKTTLRGQTLALAAKGRPSKGVTTKFAGPASRTKKVQYQALTPKVGGHPDYHTQITAQNHIWVSFLDILDFVQSENGQQLTHMGPAEKSNNSSFNKFLGISDAQIQIRNDQLFDFIKTQAYLVETAANPSHSSRYSDCEDLNGSPAESSSNLSQELVFNLNQLQEILVIFQNLQQAGHQKLQQVPKFKIDIIYQSFETFNSKKYGFPHGTRYAGKPVKIQKTNKAILIRKHDLNQYMSLSNSTKPRPLAKMLENHGFNSADIPATLNASSGGSNKAHASFVDPIDLGILECKSKIDSQYYKQSLPRWMNIAWDSFRIVDNNTNNVIFMLPDDPCSLEFRTYADKVQNPTINLETIRQKLNYRYYNSLEEFINEMLILFDNWVEFKGKSHKMFTQCDNMKKRFEKFIEKNRNKYSSGSSIIGNKTAADANDKKAAGSAASSGPEGQDGTSQVSLT